MAIDDGLKRALFGTAIGGLAVEIENFAKRRSDFALDLVIELDEGHGEIRGEQMTQGRFTGTAQADERNTLATLALDRRPEGAEEELACLRKLFRGEPVERLNEQIELDRPLRPFADEISERQIQSTGHLAQKRDRDVPLAGFELRQIALGHARIPRQDFARHPAARSRDPHPLAQLPEKVRRRQRTLG